MSRSAKKTVDQTTDLRYVSHMAAELGIHRTTIHGWIAGRKKPSPMAARLLREKFPKFYEEITNGKQSTDVR